MTVIKQGIQNVTDPTAFNVQEKAKKFYDLTLDKIGTEEKDAIDILTEAKKAGKLEELDGAIWHRLSAREKELLLGSNTPRVPIGQNNLFCIPAILAGEMSGSELDEGMRAIGDKDHAVSQPRYAADGVVNLADFSSGASKAMGVGIVTAIVLFPPLLPVALVGGAAYAGWTIGSSLDEYLQTFEQEKHVWQITSDPQQQQELAEGIEQKRKLALRDGTGAAAGLVTSTLLGPKGVKVDRTIFNNPGTMGFVGALLAVDDVTPVATQTSKIIENW